MKRNSIWILAACALFMCFGCDNATEDKSDPVVMEGGSINDEGVLTKYTGSAADVVIPEGVTSIGDYAFQWCSKLTSVTIPDSVTSIGDRAFQWCSKLTSVTIPGSVTSIGDRAFDGCTSLMEIQFEGTKEQWNAIEGSDNVDIHGIRCSDGHIGVLGVPAYLRVSGTEVTGYIGELPANVVIPEGITGIREGVFKDDTDIESVTIADSVKSLVNNAFSGCTNLTKVTIGKGVTSIGFSAFYGCTSLASVTIGDGVESIGSSAFYDCKSLTSVTIPASVTSIDNYAFSYCTNLKTVNYGGTKDEWEKINRSRTTYVYNDGLSGKTITGKDGSTWEAD